MYKFYNILLALASWHLNKIIFTYYTVKFALLGICPVSAAKCI